MLVFKKFKKRVYFFMVLLVLIFGCEKLDFPTSLESSVSSDEISLSGVICNPVSIISIPFSKDGIGEFCWETSTLCSYINSWNLERLEINGVDYKNKYILSSNILKADNKYIIHYKSKFPWGHFEIAGLCSTLTPTVIPTPTPSATCKPCTMNINGTVKDISGNPIMGAQIFIMNEEKTITDNLGNFNLAINNILSGDGCQAGDIDLIIKAQDYQQESRFIPLYCGNYTYIFILTPNLPPSPTPPPTCEPCQMKVSGTVTDSQGLPLEGVSIYLLANLKATTDNQGNYSFTINTWKPGGAANCPIGDSFLSAKLNGYADSQKFIPINCGIYNYDYRLNLLQ